MEISTVLNEEKKIRKLLHEVPELSGCEVKTKRIITSYLNNLHSIRVIYKGDWFYALYKSPNSSGRIAFRADMDAVRGEDGLAHHYCGHDGHTATLLDFAFYVNETKPDRDIYFIFQPAEETGKGALMVRELLIEEDIEEIYGFHSIPKFKKGSVILRNGTFACASQGLSLSFKGSQSHAAYPEAGNNPDTVIAEMIEYVNTLKCFELGNLHFVTVVGASIGSMSFGVSAGEGKLYLTARAERQDSFNKLIESILDRAKSLSEKAGIEFEYRAHDVFSATINDPNLVDGIEDIAVKNNIEVIRPSEPFRWSEDFGYYLRVCKGVFFGVGDGEDYPQLHTSEFEFPDDIAETVLKIYMGLICSI